MSPPRGQLPVPAALLLPLLLLLLPVAGPLLAGCPELRTPDQRARDAMARTAAAPVELPLPGGTVLRVPGGRLSAVNVTAAEDESGRLVGSGQISVEGAVGPILVSYLGSEQFVVRCGRECELEAPPLARLRAVLVALQARRAALAGGDREALLALAGAGYEDEGGARESLAGRELGPAAAREAAGWFVRVDRESAVVGEAVADGAQRMLRLERDGERYLFVGGLL